MYAQVPSPSRSFSAATRVAVASSGVSPRRAEFSISIRPTTSASVEEIASTILDSWRSKLVSSQAPRGRQPPRTLVPSPSMLVYGVQPGMSSPRVVK